MANPALPILGYNPGAGTGHAHAVPDLAGWQDTYQRIGPGATAAGPTGQPFATCTKLFDTTNGYPAFPTGWGGAAQIIANNNGGVPVMPMIVFGSGPGPTTQPPQPATILGFLQSLPPGQRVAFNFISEVESASDGLTASQYVNNWVQISTTLNSALAQMAQATGNRSFWTRANFPFITASLMSYYGSPQANDPNHTAWLPPPQHVDAYGADFYQRIGGTQSVGAQNDPRFQGWLKAVYLKAGSTNVPLALPEYGIGFNPGVYTAAAEAGRGQLLQKDFAYFTGSSRPSGTQPMAFWDYWYQMDGGINIYCFPLAPVPGAGETQAQAIGTINVWQSIVAFSQQGTGQNTVTVTNPGTQNATAGQAITPLQIIASDSNPALALTYSATGLPPGLVIAAGTGIISGTPTAAGTYTPAVTATDPTLAAGSQTFTWVVNISSQPQVTVTNPGAQVSTVNVAVALQIAAADSAGNPLTYAATGLPAGLSINASTGVISGTPTTPRAAATVTVTATDSLASVSGQASFTWAVVTSAVSIVNPGPQANLTTDTVSLQINASDSNAALTLSYAAVGLPGGLSIAAGTGLITGTPAVAAATVTVTATDTAGAHNSVTFTWQVRSPTGPTVTVANPGTQTSTQFKAGVSLQITATDSAGQPVSFSASGLPAGLSISAAGLITGTPTTVQTVVVTVTGTDSPAGATGQAVFTWKIVGPVVAVASPGNQSSITNEAIRLQLTATDTDGSGVTYSATGLPTGLSISLGGLITGTCTAAGTFTPVITGTGGHGITGQVTFTWAVAAVTVTVTPPANQINNVGDTVSLQLAAIDSSDNALTWAAVNLPFPLAVNPATGLITGVPSTPGTYAVVVTATDATASVSGSAGFTWTVDVSTPVLAISIAPAAGTDIYGNKYPAGVTVGSNPAQRTTIGMNGALAYSTPSISLQTPAMINGWSIANGHAKVQLDALGNLVISFKILGIGTVTDNTQIWPVGTLPVGYRPATKRRVSCYCDVPAASKGPALEFDPDGSIRCFGIGATATRVELYIAATILL